MTRPQIIRHQYQLPARTADPPYVPRMSLSGALRGPGIMIPSAVGIASFQSRSLLFSRGGFCKVASTSGNHSFGPKTGAFMVKGIQSIAPVAAIFIFAILYIGIMSDVGMLDPIIERILRVVGNRP